MKTNEEGKSNFFCKMSLNKNKTPVAKIARKKPIKKLPLNPVLKSFLDFLKKSALVECLIPNETKGARRIKLLENKLKIPLSVGVRYLGLVNIGISSSEMPLEKKLVNM